MKEIKFEGYLRPNGVRAKCADATRKAIEDAVRSYGDIRDLECEVIVRLRDHRQEWIDRYHDRAMKAIDLGLYNLQFCKDTTILVERNPFPTITTSAPRHGDKYDRKTGIAVAYAKQLHDPVPDYI